MASKFDVLLIGAFESTDSSRLRFLAPPLGIERLAAYLRRHGYTVQTIDPNIDGAGAVRRCVRQQQPQVVGFSISYITLLNDLSLIFYAKRHLPHALLIAGGQQATFDYYNIMRVAPLDLIVLGDGEYPLLEIVKRKLAGGDVYSVPGTVTQVAGKVTRIGNNEPFTTEQFRDVSLGVDFSRIDYRKYWHEIESFYPEPNFFETRTIRLFTINYCPFHCTYCSSRSFLNAAKGSVDENFNPKGKVTRLAGLGPEDMVALIRKALVVYPDTHTFYMQEDEHMLQRGRVEKFSTLAAQLKSGGELPQHIQFMCQSRVEDVNPNMLGLMKQAGYSLIGYGVEAFSQKMLESVKKFNSVQDIHNALNWTMAAGIKPFVNLIMLLPEITHEDLLITIDSALDYIERGIEVATEPFVLPLPGSALLYDQRYEKHTEQVQIAGSAQQVERIHFVIPKQQQMRDLAFHFHEHHEAHLEMVSTRYHFRHLPTRLRSLITFHTMLTWLGDADRCRRVEQQFERIAALQNNVQSAFFFNDMRQAAPEIVHEERVDV